MKLPKGLLYLFHAIILLLCTSQSLCSPTTTSLANNATDRLALLSFKSMLSDPLKALTSWNDTLHFCRWQGVSCGRQHSDRVTALSLNSLKLTGPISPHITNLTFLKVLRLSDNNLKGRIPYELGRLSRLKNLNLSMNFLDGEIPASLTLCSNLQAISLRNNELTGEIPREIGSLSNLWALNLGENNLTGSIPPSIGNISSLLGLLLHKNGLEGSIPESMGKLSNLQILQVAENKLSGEIPSSLYNLSAVEIISAMTNNLTGTLSPTMFNTLRNLQTLLLASNNFYGPIPISLPNASNLGDIELSSNSFTGSVPSDLGNLKYLYWFELGDNQLEAREASDWNFLNSLTNCSQLVMLDLENNRLGGNLPSSIANLSSTLDILILEMNQISGTIPAEIGNLVNLTVLTMANNRLNGPIPATIGKLENLHTLSLLGNSLIGQIPYSIGNLTKLIRLYLGSNGLNGSIPMSFGNLKNLEELDLSQNKLTGAIPKELLSLSSLSIYLNLSYNLLSGPLPLEVGKLTNLDGFAISNNKLSGKIPSALGDCQSLEYLYLQSNSFEGAIPQSVSKLKGLRELDLSCNNLSGEIPDFLGRLGGLVFLNLSYNDLEGEVPKEGVFRNASSLSLLGDNKLCGGSLVFHLPPCYAHSTRKKHLSLALKVVIPVLSVVVFLVIFLLLYAALRRMKNLRKGKSFKPPIGDQFTRVSYAELLKATDGFSSSNLIGAGSFGSVYKGIMGSDEKIVAVKVLNLQKDGASKSFIAECEALKNIRHRNLVKILTACASSDFKGNDFKALVLMYMPNGSLEDWLHPDTAMRALTIVQRLNIAIDVASALDYLHHHGQTPIVHCDLKPSNVLLDEDLCAHVGDFGLARFILDEVSKPEEHQTVSIGVKGTIGYVAPEYGMGGQASTHGDVYSYGILLLELFTGKRPTDEMFKDGLNLHKYVEMAFPERVMDIVDPCLLPTEDDQEAESNIQSRTDTRMEEAKCLASIISIGLKCSKGDSRERMEMGDVTKELQAIRDILVIQIHGGR